MDQKQVIEEYEISDKLSVKVSVTYDESKIFLDINYLNGKFTIQKHFTNNYIGLEELQMAKIEFQSEEKVKKYFGL